MTKQSDVRISSAAALIGSVPSLVGFYPENSIVVIASGTDNMLAFAMRYDLPEGDDHIADVIENAAGHVSRDNIGAVMMVGYGPAAKVTKVADMFMAAFRLLGVRLGEVARVEGGRYWSYMCEDPECCPPDGKPFEDAAAPVVAQLAEAGDVARASRDSLYADLGPYAEPRQSVVFRCFGQAKTSVATALTADGRSKVIDDARAEVDRVLAINIAGEGVGDDVLCHVAVLLNMIEVRDHMWAGLKYEDRWDNARLLRELARHAQGIYSVPALTLLAWAHWQCGSGAAANIAVERALEMNPDYLFAHLMRDALMVGMPYTPGVLGDVTQESIKAGFDEGDTDATDDK